MGGDDVEKFQSCSTNADCVYANAGVCDCANGGRETAVNVNMLNEFSQLFFNSGSTCGDETRTIPCGIGGGISCQDGVCFFEQCQDTQKALLCENTNTTENQSISSVKERMDCFRKACTRTTPDNTGTFIRDNELVEGRLPQAALAVFQECVTDDDCVYANNGSCDCANGGEQVAINKNNQESFVNLFKLLNVPCTEEKSPIPCDIGGGIKCERSRCVFHECGNTAKAMKCPDRSTACMEDACKTTAKLRRPN